MNRAAGIAIILGCTVISSQLFAGGHRRAAVTSRTAVPAITFLDAATGVIDGGVISWDGSGRRGARTTQIVSSRIGAPSSSPAGTVTLRASLENADPNCRIRVDGILLSTMPQVVQRHAPVGVIVQRRIEIEVPVAAPEGPVQTTIRWEVSEE